MRYLLIIGLLVSLNAQAQKTIRTDRLYLNESLELNKIFSGDTLAFLVQNKASGAGLIVNLKRPTTTFDFFAGDLGFALNYANGDSNTFDVRDGGVLLQWGVNDGNVGIGTETPTEKLHVVGTSVFTDTLTYDIPSAASGYVLTSQDAIGNSKWQDPNAYGEMGFGDSTRTIALTQNVFSVVTNTAKNLLSAGATTLHNVTYQGDSLKIDSAGTYQIIVNLSVDGTNASVLKLGVFKNGVIMNGNTGHIELVYNHTVQISYNDIAPLAVGDGLRIVIMNTASNADVDARNGKITINKLR
jgi:hypothetical protein